MYVQEQTQEGGEWADDETDQRDVRDEAEAGEGAGADPRPSQVQYTKQEHTAEGLLSSVLCIPNRQDICPL